jgi:hypothetical protein
VLRKLLIVLILISPWLPGRASAQDLEPRRWSHLPVGQNMLGLGYIYTDANVFFNPALSISDASSRINSLGLTAIHSFDLAGKSARFSALLPYSSGQWVGNVGGEFRIIDRKGAGDPRLRFSVNLYGAPALSGEEFTQYRTQHAINTVVGASLAVTLPLGRYCDDCLINIGTNRWSLRPQMGVVHTRGPWSFELTGSVFLFSDNNNFVDSAILKQDPLYTLQTHVIYNFKPRTWISFGSAYGKGGRIRIDQQDTLFEVDNWVWSASFAFPIGKSQSLRLAWLSGHTINPLCSMSLRS